jgi:DNA-binding NtrC family response regulator
VSALPNAAAEISAPLPPRTPPVTAAPAALAPTRPLRAPQPQAPAEPQRRGATGGSAVRVLVVDDEPTICKALTIALVRDGYEVLSALGGEAAHALLAAERVDVMIVDLRMPDLRGDVVYHLASALQPWLEARTVFTTGDISERAEQIVAACGCPLLRKPFSIAEALAAVRAVAPAEGASRTA